MHRLLARLVPLAALAVASIVSAPAAELPRVAGEYAWAEAKSAPATLLIDKALSAVDAIALPAPEPSLIADAQRANRSPNAKALKIGIPRALAETTGTPRWTPDLQWHATAGKLVAQLRVTSAEAAAMRVALSFGHLPAGIELRVTGREGEAVLGPLTAADLRVQLDADGRYWSPVTEGDVQWLEISLPAGTDTAALGLAVEGVSHLFTSVTERFKQAKAIGASGSCEVDMACVSSPSAALLAAARSVAKMIFTSSGSSYLCTGTLLNDADAGTQVPYFMTANHCINRQVEAGTLNTYWFYDAASCDSLAVPAYTLLSGGAVLLVNRPELDSTLLRLANSAPANAFFSGYDANALALQATFTIVHHPAGDVKKVSQGRVTGFTTAGEIPGLAGGFTTVGYTFASTEGGSSGGALLTLANGQYYLRGTLYGGAASCSNTGDFAPNTDNYDFYSRFDQFYDHVKSYIGPIAVRQAVEFYNSALGHYFVASEPGEISSVDNGGAGPGWSRTGLSFSVLTAISSAYPASNVSCRFYGTPGIGPNSHFYATETGECNIVKAQAGWTYEGLAFASINPTAQACPAGTSPVYRAYNNGFATNNSNHRYSTSLATLQAMAGWTVEGIGGPAPVLCAPN
jgi:hypothetical protein